MLIVLTGPASAGKDTVLSKLLQQNPNLKRVISTTTRPKRPAEVDGKDYYFVSKEQFQQMINNQDFLEYVDFSGNFYGTTKRELEPLNRGEDLVWRVETSRAAKINEVIPADLQKQTVVIYIDVPDWEVLKQRMKQRGMSEEEIEQRLAQDKKDFETYGSNFSHIIYNQQGEIDKTMQEVDNALQTAHENP